MQILLNYKYSLAHFRQIYYYLSHQIKLLTLKLLSEMKKIGIIGGMSMESTLHYCSCIYEQISKKLGGHNSPEIVMVTVNFAEIVEMQNNGDWETAGAILNNAAKNLENSGADFIVMTTNTMHKVADKMMEEINIPLLHIVDATLECLKANNITKVGLLGTSFTMSDGFYEKILNDAGVEVVVPEERQQRELNRIIYDELCKGDVKPFSRAIYKAMIEKLRENGAQGIILGSTELGMLRVNVSPIPVYDSTAIHIKKAVSEALKD